MSESRIPYGEDFPNTGDNLILDDGQLQKYYAAIPHMVDDMGLTPFEYRLYGHLKRVAGENGGKCWQSTKTLAEICGMSTGQVSEAKHTLEDKNLIVVQEVPKDGRLYHEILVIDIWLQNIEKYTKARSSHERPRSYSELDRSPGETKNNPIKKNPIISAGQEAASGEEVSSGLVELSFPEGLNEAKSKALKFDCTFCGEKQTISWQDINTPCCGAEISWANNKWLAKRLKAAKADSKKHERDAALLTEMAQNPALQYVKDVIGELPKFDEKSRITSYVAQNGLESFKLIVDKVQAGKAENQSPRGVMVHLLNALPVYGKVEPKSPTGQPKEHGFIPLS